MIDKLQSVEDRYERLNELLSDPTVISDSNKLREYSKEQAGIQEIVSVYRNFKNVRQQHADTREMLEENLDAEMREMVKDEFDSLTKELESLQEKIRILMIPKDPNDDKNVIMEVRGAAGGDEAALFAGNLFRMYTRYAESNGWKVEVLDSNPTGIGGFKEVVFMISGTGAYSKLKYENGAHRVQRVPETESSGRIHTSTATVACMPEAEEVDILINDNDIRIDTFCSSGAGGQSVNTTKSAVRVTHIPTGIMATCQDGKSQNSNKDQALKVLRARIYEIEQKKIQDELDATRKSAVGTGDRSERIRTYNYPQSRVTDHRIGLTLQKLDTIMEGKLDEIIDALTLDDQTRRLNNEENQ
ncbi:MAG: prfA [Bacillales bacterium]|jgi:peptide chain release factor 1|nr:prfA [Bacillales bacterium]